MALPVSQQGYHQYASAILALSLRMTYAESVRVTDGARTRDLRSHNPMLYQLSYGHQARTKFYQEKETIE
jgi:hypothetical protein